VYFINKCYIVFPVGVCILPDGLAGRGELAIPVSLFFLTVSVEKSGVDWSNLTRQELPTGIVSCRPSDRE